jgi:hypothetical protein
MTVCVISGRGREASLYCQSYPRIVWMDVGFIIGNTCQLWYLDVQSPIRIRLILDLSTLSSVSSVCHTDSAVCQARIPGIAGIRVLEFCCSAFPRNGYLSELHLPAGTTVTSIAGQIRAIADDEPRLMIVSIRGDQRSRMHLSCIFSWHNVHRTHADPTAGPPGVYSCRRN